MVRKSTVASRRSPVVVSSSVDGVEERHHHNRRVTGGSSSSSVAARCSTRTAGGATFVRPQVARSDAAPTADVRELHSPPRRTTPRTQDVQEARTSAEEAAATEDDDTAAAVSRSDAGRLLSVRTTGRQHLGSGEAGQLSGRRHSSLVASNDDRHPTMVSRVHILSVSIYHQRMW